MKLLNTLAILLLAVLTSTLHAQTSDYYKYQITEDKKGKQSDVGFLEFWKSQNVLLSKKTAGKYPAPLKIFDLAKKVVIFDMAPRTEYIVEELDSLYYVNAKLTEGGSERVNGYMCKKYKADVTLSFGSGIYGLQTSQYDYSFIFWITNDLNGTDDVNTYIASCMTTNMVRISNKGVIVKMYCASAGSSGTYTLVETGKKEKEYVAPWKASEKSVALVPETNRYTREKYTDYLKRMRALQATLTGVEKPKFNVRPIYLDLQ